MNYREVKGNVFEKLQDGMFLVQFTSADFELGSNMEEAVNKRFDTKKYLDRGYPGFLNSYKKLGIKGTCLRTYNVLNLVTKAHPWEAPTNDSLRQALVSMRDMFNPDKYTVQVVMPKGRVGSMGWDEVSTMIQDVFDGANFDITVCTH